MIEEVVLLYALTLIICPHHAVSISVTTEAQLCSNISFKEQFIFLTLISSNKKYYENTYFKLQIIIGNTISRNLDSM